jgi:DNA-binding transcriptional ArsR family regulator
MRPPPHSSFRAPLDDVLSSPANLRVLRALGNRTLSQPEIGRRTGLSKPSVSRAVQSLWALGILTARGVREPTSVRADHPIASAVLALLCAERQRAEGVLSALKDVFGRDAQSVWLEGPVACGQDGPQDSIAVGVLLDADKLDAVRTRAEPRLAELETAAAVLIDARYYTRADLMARIKAPTGRHGGKSLGPIVPVSEIPPSAFLSKPRTRLRKRTQADRDAEGLLRARALAGLIENDATLVPRALIWLDDRLTTADVGLGRTLREWKRILRAATPAQLRRLLTEESERATRLRQSNPLYPVLTSDERHALVERLGAS